MADLTFSAAAWESYDAACTDRESAMVIDRILDSLQGVGDVRSQPWVIGEGHLVSLTTEPIAGRNADAVVIWERKVDHIRVIWIEVVSALPLT